jgi:hypothetical protein
MHSSSYSTSSKKSTAQQNNSAGGQPGLMQEYEIELDRLRQENNEIRMVKDLRERDFENVMFENA